tara:strand:+ start:10326 stop:12746 length:2421 start_codon:yes stop_codon:yes gene_type:complete
MSLISSNVPNLVNGVSQQADSLRFPSQGVEQVNCMSSVIDGLSKRPPTVHIEKLLNAGVIGSDSTFHYINRDSAEKYVLCIYGGATPEVKIFDLDGVEQTVVNSSDLPLTAGDKAYLATTVPNTALKFKTIADYTFIANTETTVAMDSGLSATSPKEALVFCRLAQSGTATTYEIKLYNTPGGPLAYTGTHTTISGDTQADIIAALHTNLAGAGAGAVYTLVYDNELMHIRRTDNTDFRIEITSEVPDAMYSIKGDIQSYAQLPEYGYAGFKVKISGVPEDTADDYWVEFQSATDGITSGFTQGSWVETMAPAIEYQLDASTMPLELISEPTQFKLQESTWGERTVGDTESVPDPSFVGSNIRNLIYHKNRLGFLSDENVILSEAGGFFNFFRTTVITALDSDPIDVGASHSEVSKLNHAVANSEKLLLFSDNAQFVLSGEPLLTPATVDIQPVTDYQSYLDIEPASVGNSIFFTFNKGLYSGVQEYTVNPVSQLFDAKEVTSHIPRYIEGNVTNIQGSDAESILAIQSDGFTQGCYIFKYFDDADKRVQAAWFKFDFGSEVTVRDLFFDGTEIYFILSRTDGTYMESMDVSSGLKDPYSEYPVLLDRKVDETECSGIAYDAITGLTTVVLPYVPDAGSEIVVTTRSTASFTGSVRLNEVAYASSTVTIAGDYSAVPLWLGQTYTKEYTMTKPTLRAVKSGFSAPVNEGRWQVRYGLLTYNDSVYFKTGVTAKYRDTRYKKLKPIQLGTGNAIIDQALVGSDGSFRFPVYSKNDQVDITITNDSPFPSHILSVDWEGVYSRRNRSA